MPENTPQAGQPVDTHTATLTLSVDRARWVAEYGNAPDEVDRSVEDYVLSALSQSAAAAAGAFIVTGYRMECHA